MEHADIVKIRAECCHYHEVINLVYLSVKQVSVSSLML